MSKSFCFYTQETIDEAQAIINRAWKVAEIELTESDFEVVDGDLYLDGMNPDEWIDAMAMD